MKTWTRTMERQRGMVLLTLFLVLFAVGATLFLSSVNTHAVEMRRFNNIRAEMEKAKQALIAYAANYPYLGFDYDSDTYTDDGGPGRLICPDVDNDGVAESNVTDCTDNVRGRLPETVSYNGNVLMFNNVFANIDQQFWYVVSPAFKEITSTDVNHLTTGSLSIDGKSGYAAVIIAPGEALIGQDRASSPTSASNYLEQGNLSGTSFVNSYSTDPDAFNDQVIGITPGELMIQTLRDDIFNNKLSTIREKMRQALAAYWTANSTIPTTLTALNTYMQDKGYGWYVDENYLPTSFSNYYYNSYPYIRYNVTGCTTYWYWFIPVSPYSPNFTYVSGTPC